MKMQPTLERALRHKEKKPEMTPNAGGAYRPDMGAGFSADPLTRIRGKYTLSNTKESGSEVDELTVKNFLNTLAEVALAVAARQGNKLTDKDGSGASKGSGLHSGQ